MTWWARVRAVLGPWPVQPAVSAGVYLALIFSYFIGVNTSAVLLPHVLVLPTLLAGALIYVVLKLIRRVQDRRGPSWWTTGLAILGIWIVLQVVRAGYGLAPTGESRVVVVFAPTFLRGITATFIIITAIGYAANRLQREANQAKEALELAREQQVQIIEADEAAKRQAALLLHDRVQAGLIASCLELQSFARGLGDEKKAELRPIVSRLERMRSIDVGSAARVLSPNLVDLDLTTALEELAGQYENVVDVVVDVDDRVESEYLSIGENVLLGAYRIIEQGLLNAVKHAKPNHVWVSVALGTGELQVQVSDDGVGMPTEVTSGIGTTIITTWARALDGSWSWERGPVARGTTLLAVLPVEMVN